MKDSSLALLLAACAAAPALEAQGREMQNVEVAGPHITLTPAWAERPGDRARADSVAAIARAAVERYRDVSVAEADGYRRFAPRVRHQRVYHYTSAAAGLKARFRFDPAAPTALLYQGDSAGGLRLVGVMYTMPAGASLEDLDRRIPLSIARWHQHTNICLPPRAAADPGADGAAPPEFGPRGRIATREACEAAGGRWFDRRFGWMVHVNLYAPTPQSVWGHQPGGMRHH